MNRSAIYLLTLFSASSLHADFVRLKDGRFLNARVAAIRGKSYDLIGADSRKFSLPSGDIDRLFVGTDPIPGCVRSDSENKCGLIFQIGPDSVVWGNRSVTATECIDMKGKGIILQKTDSPSERMSAILTPGAQVDFIDSSGAKVKGVVKKITGSRIEFADGKTFQDREIKRTTSGRVFHDSKFRYLMPGLMQIGRGEKKGWVMLGAFSGLSVLTFLEFQSQVRIKKDLSGNSLGHYFGVEEKRRQFDQHRKREIVFATLAAATFGFSFYDAYRGELRLTSDRESRAELVFVNRF